MKVKERGNQNEEERQRQAVPRNCYRGNPLERICFDEGERGEADCLDEGYCRWTLCSSCGT